MDTIKLAKLLNRAIARSSIENHTCNGGDIRVSTLPIRFIMDGKKYHITYTIERSRCNPNYEVTHKETTTRWTSNNSGVVKRRLVLKSLFNQTSWDKIQEMHRYVRFQ